MRVTVERLPGSAVKLEIAADDDEYKVAYDKTLRDLGREASIPGFRKGKAPRHMLERIVGREALVQETNRDLMEELFRKAVDQESLVPVSQPEVDITQEDPLSFNVTVEVYPTATLGDYRAVRVETREVDVTDEDVATVVEEGRKNLAPWVSYDPPRRPSEGDQVVIDMSVYDGDELFMPPAYDETFVLGETPLFESIVEALKLMLPGSGGELTLAFEEDDASVGPELRGKTLRYEFTLKDVRHRELPELNDEYAVANSSYDTLEEMVGRVRRDLLRARAGEARNEVVTEIIDAMTATAELEIPNGLIEREIDEDINQTRARFAAQGLSYEDFLRIMQTTDEEYRAQLREGVEQRLRRGIVLQEIAKAEAIEVTDEEIEAEIDRVVGDAPNPERRRRLFSSDYFRDQLKNELFDRKLTERLIEIATEGRGAISGPGAELYAAGPEPPPPPRAVAAPVEVEAEGEVVAPEAAAEQEGTLGRRTSSRGD
ncbi:MAG: trigger factor [Chloroflexi bacterium]|nr:MAG: trigger factor [Chloroflexota bacterium]